MSPELERVVATLEHKACQPILPAQERVLAALKEVGAVRAASLIQLLIEQDHQRKVEALEEATRVRLASRK
jgi:NAD-dependent DNA ligase